MAKQTKRDKIVESLLKAGHEEMECKSGKYRQFTVMGRDEEFFFVGKKGALRIGKCATKSLSLTNSTFYKNLLK